MINIHQLYEKIQVEAAPLGLDVFCYRLVELVMGSAVSNPAYTYSALMEAVGGCAIEDLQRALNYLKASPICLFAQQYQYVDVDGVPHDITREDLQAAMLDDALSHPEHGYLDPDFKDRVYILYVADKTVIES
jgi:hypothetical protein